MEEVTSAAGENFLRFECILSGAGVSECTWPEARSVRAERAPSVYYFSLWFVCLPTVCRVVISGGRRGRSPPKNFWTCGRFAWKSPEKDLGLAISGDAYYARNTGYLKGAFPLPLLFFAPFLPPREYSFWYSLA